MGQAVAESDKGHSGVERRVERPQRGGHAEEGTVEGQQNNSVLKTEFHAGYRLRENRELRIAHLAI